MLWLIISQFAVLLPGYRPISLSPPPAPQSLPSCLPPPVAHSFCSITSCQAGNLMHGACLFPRLHTMDPVVSVQAHLHPRSTRSCQTSHCRVGRGCVEHAKPAGERAATVQPELHAQPHQSVLLIELRCWRYPESICRVLEGALCIPKGCSGGLGKESRGYSQPAGSVSPHPSPSVVQVLRGKVVSFPHLACSLLGHME